MAGPSNNAPIPGLGAEGYGDPGPAWPGNSQPQHSQAFLALLDPRLFGKANGDQSVPSGPPTQANLPPSALPVSAEAQENHPPIHPQPGFIPPLSLMRPAQVQSAPLAMPAPQPAAAPPAPQQGNNNGNLAQSLQTIWRNTWDQIIDVDCVREDQDVPASLRTQVLNELASKRYEWSGNRLYREVVGIDKMKDGDLQKLKEWMYGAGHAIAATWRDTLRTKAEGARKVPWVKRERLIALSIVFVAAREDHNGRDTKMHSKASMIKDCKLDWLLSGHDQVVADPYWAGFTDELARDPEQEHLYDNVMRMRVKKSPKPENIKQEPGLHGYNLRSSRQGNHSHQARVGEAQAGGGQDESLEDKVRRLEEENEALRRALDR